MNFGEKCSEKSYSLQNTKFNSIQQSLFQLLKPVQITSELIKILWQFFCSHAIITDLTIPGKLSDNLALETTKWDKSFKVTTNKCYRSILQKYSRLSSKVLRLLYWDTGPSIWLFSLYTLHICDFSPLLFQEMFSNILQSETLLFQLSFTSSAITRSLRLDKLRGDTCSYVCPQTWLN